MMNLIEQLKKHEGFESDYYQCTANKTTIGYGRNVESNPFTEDELLMLGRDDFNLEPMSQDEAEELLVNDVKNIISKIKDNLPWVELNEPRKAVCVNMAFNLGVNGFFKFRNMIRAIRKGCYKEAAIEALDSRWANQVGNRADELAKQLSSGEWQ